LAAGRGAGKTFCLAIYVAWRITCFDYFTITVMGGSAEQSSKIKEYVDYWRVMSKEIDYCINRSVSGGNRPAQIHNRWGSYARFPACSETAARGPHVTQVIIDEVCVGESKSSGGALAIRSARGQLTSSAESLLMYTSTAQYIFGTFFNTWRKAEKLGFKKYRWSVGRYYDEEQWFMPGTKEPNWNLIDTLLYKDRDPKHWKSNVWWITDEDVKNYRINGTDDEFLVEVLGGISRGSGLVFSRDDLAEVICNGMKYREDGLECDECHPYDPERCPMMKAKELEIAMIGNRKMGVDFGEISPNAVTLMGERGEDVYCEEPLFPVGHRGAPFVRVVAPFLGVHLGHLHSLLRGVEGNRERLVLLGQQRREMLFERDGFRHINAPFLACSRLASARGLQSVPPAGLCPCSLR